MASEGRKKHSMSSPAVALGEMARLLERGVEDGDNFSRLLKPVHLLEVVGEEGFVKAELVVKKEHCNMVDVLHGGMISLLIDAIGVLAVLARARHLNKPNAGFSAEMDMAFVRPAQLDDTVIIEARCLKLGKSLSFAQVDLFRKSDGAMVATGRHTLQNVMSKV